eukprot:140816_1
MAPQLLPITLFDVFIMSYSVIHLHLIYRMFIRKDESVFNKYEKSFRQKGQRLKQITIANRVYYTKASWMIMLVLLQYFNLSFRSSMVYTFSIYCFELVLLFPINSYIIINVVMAMLCFVEHIYLMYW